MKLCHQLTRAVIACFLFGALLYSDHASAGENDAAVATISPVVTQFLGTNCVRCHDPDEQNADVRLDTMPNTIPDGTIALQWQDVMRFRFCHDSHR